MSDTVITALEYLLIACSGGVIITILLQNRAEGLGLMFGGGGEAYRSKRGMQKILHNLTIVLIIAIAVLSLIIVKYS